MLASAAISKIMYAVDKWSTATKYKSYTALIQRMLRRLAITRSQSYSPVSHEVAMTLGRILPAELLIEERSL